MWSGREECLEDGDWLVGVESGYATLRDEAECAIRDT